MARTPRIGPVTFFQLLARYGSARAVIKALPKLSPRGARVKLAPRAVTDEEWQNTRAYGAEIICASDPAFPTLLTQFSPPPPILTYFGRLSCTHRRCVAIVGARQASAAGRKLARDIARDLSKAGYQIVSGLARGVDGEAHAASLAGGTIAVLGGGIDHIYPPQHATLYKAIAESGCIISESPFGHRATARDFPRRNRIVTGLAEGVVIIEAAERSGSLISARTALEQNREVMAVPGSPLDPRTAGNNRLIREGATLVRNAEDVIEALNMPLPRRLEAPSTPKFEASLEPIGEIPDTQLKAVLSLLSPTPVTIEDLAQAAQISVARCASVLVELELAGQAATFPGGLAALAV